MFLLFSDVASPPPFPPPPSPLPPSLLPYFTSSTPATPPRPSLPDSPSSSSFSVFITSFVGAPAIQRNTLFLCFPRSSKEMSPPLLPSVPGVLDAVSGQTGQAEGAGLDPYPSWPPWGRGGCGTRKALPSLRESQAPGHLVLLQFPLSLPPHLKILWLQCRHMKE